MINTKYLGIYMDHANANLIEYFKDAPGKIKNIKSDFTNTEMKRTLNEGEKVEHNTEKHEEAEYYKKLEKQILNYNEVVLFGPTEAKAELLNILNKDHRFANINIQTQSTDKLTEEKQHHYVNEYFSSH